MIATAPLSELAVDGGLVGGPFGSSLVSRDYQSVGIPVIRGSNLSEGKYLSGDYVYVSSDKFQRDLERNDALPGDLIFTQRGTLGQISIVPYGRHVRLVVSQSQMRLRVDLAKALPEYVYYACCSRNFRQQIMDSAITTGVPHINLGILSRLTIPLPGAHLQRAIAEVLGALDDKIAANARASRIAGELARTFFASAQRGANIYERPFKEIVAVGGGGTPRTGEPNFWNGPVPWATPTDITALSGPYLEKTERMITEAGLSACSSPLYPAGSILMTSRATIGAFAIAGQPTAVNQGFIVVNPLEDMIRWWIFHDMASRVDEFVSHANGATFMELSRGRFKELPARLADTQTMRAFSERAAALHNAARQGLRESVVLTELRDTLLPQLMSGKLRVRDAEKQVEAAV